MPNPSNANHQPLEDEREQEHSSSSSHVSSSDRRTFLHGAAATAVAGAAALSWPGLVSGAPAAGDLEAIRAEIEKRHDESVKRLQDWIRQPSIAAENRGMNEGCELTIHMLRDAGFQQATKVPTDGQPGIFATRGIPASHESSYGRPARHLRHARCRRSAHSGPLLHVRREAGRSRRVVFAAVRSHSR